jgi:hypothetical protein
MENAQGHISYRKETKDYSIGISPRLGNYPSGEIRNKKYEETYICSKKALYDYSRDGCNRIPKKNIDKYLKDLEHYHQ